MRVGILDWASNAVILVCLGLILLNTFFLLYDDIFDRYGKGKIVARLEEPGSFHGLSYLVEFLDPKTGVPYRSQWNPISVGDARVGDEVPVRFRWRNPSAFSPGSDPDYRLVNTIKVFAVLGGFIAAAFALRYFLALRK